MSMKRKCDKVSVRISAIPGNNIIMQTYKQLADIAKKSCLRLQAAPEAAA